ncbi:MAG: hypothetical protein ABSG63_00755 [Spirochaetia bacterium]|jgi:hypothetical protein
MRFQTFVFIVVLTLVAPFVASAQESTTTGDHRIANILDRTGLKYSVDSDGNFSLKLFLDKDRSQVVFIMGSAEKIDKLEVIELWSSAGTFDSLPEEDVVRDLLADSGTKPIGFWSVEGATDGGYTVYFSVRVPLYVKDSDLVSLLRYTANIANQEEKELFYSDEHLPDAALHENPTKGI